MARKTIGFVPLIWICPSCDTQNPGPIKTCISCGAPQPTDIQFLQVDEERFNFIKDEALIRMAQTGPDIHCPYCGTRNPATAKLCSNCGGDLSLGGKARQVGQRVKTVSEAEKSEAVPRVTTPEPKKGLSRGAILFGIIAILACLAGAIALMMMLFRTDEITATVTDVAWERSVNIEAYTTVTDQDWWDEIPGGADIRSCKSTYRYTTDQPQANATEVCGEAYVEDTGTGVGEVVQECVYDVYDDYCEYTYLGWVIVDAITETGSDVYPSWPYVALEGDQREGERTEKYQIRFSGDGERYIYTTSDAQLFQMASPGSRWILEVNSLGGVQSIEPYN